MKKLILFILIIEIGGLMTACNPKTQVDLIVKNATIYTVDDSFSTQEAFAVKDGKFVAVGSIPEIEENFVAKENIDLKGNYVYPGFIDAHAHFYGYGLGLQNEAQLFGTSSEQAILDILENFQNQRQNAWVLGRGWDQNDWTNATFPTKEGLDKLFPNTPVYLARIDGHAAWVNSKALELANITSETKVEGGEIKFKNGEPTGILIDNAMELVHSLIPQPDKNTQIKALRVAQENCFAVGLTGVTDAGLDFDIVQLIDSLQQNNQLQMRANVMLSPTTRNFEYFLPKGPYVTDKLSVRSIKLYADGALGSRGACLLSPYSDDPGNYGLMIEPEDYYRAICKKALESNFQMATHAIGDSANRTMLKIYGEFLNGKNDKRWRIEHAQIVAFSDIDMFGKYSIVPSVQPTHATSDMYWAEERLGAERIKEAYQYQNLLKQNQWIPLGTDFPIEKIDPLLTFYAAVSRKDINNYPEKGFQTDEALSREEALKGITLWAAYSAFEEDKKGSIEKGKFADFVVLEKDILHCETIEIPNVKVLYTFLNGSAVFTRL